MYYYAVLCRYPQSKYITRLYVHCKPLFIAIVLICALVVYLKCTYMMAFGLQPLDFVYVAITTLNIRSVWHVTSIAHIYMHASTHTCMHARTHAHILVEETTRLCRTSRLSINAKDEDNYCMNKLEKFWRVWDLILGHATHSLGS